jgi:hypothetical protein
MDYILGLVHVLILLPLLLLLASLRVPITVYNDFRWYCLYLCTRSNFTTPPVLYPK